MPFMCVLKTIPKIVKTVAISAVALFVISGCTMDVDERVESLRLESEKNIAAGNEFLAKNRNEPGVIETKSGLQYRVIRAGEGASPMADDTVEVHYRGRLMDNTEFDSSYNRGKPAEFPVNRLIPGWTEALQLMKPGSHWVIYVPENLAYGKRSPSRRIPPSSLLIFEMELFRVLPRH